MDEADKLTDDVQLEILVRRLEALVANAPFGVTSGLITVALTVLAFFDWSWAEPVLGWAAASTAVLLARLEALRRVDMSLRDYTYLRRAYNRVSVLLIAMSVLWTLGLSLFGMIVSGFEVALLAGIGVALFTGVQMMHKTTPKAALAHVVLVMIGLFAAGWIAAGQPSFLLLTLLTFYGAVLCIAVKRQDVAFVEGVVIDRQRRRAADTVAMLLNDYEQHSSDWLWTVDERGEMEGVSLRFAEAAGRTVEELEGRSLLDLFAPGEARDRLARHIVERSAFRDLVLKLRHDEDLRFWRLSACQREDGLLSGVSRDVTADKLIEDRVVFMAHFDSLTGLANRYLFNERLRKALSGDKPGNVVLFYLDLDDFKGINDTRGHIAGDRLLREIGTRLESEIRPEDMVARLGGDEFAVLLESRAGAGMMIERAHRFLSAIREPIEIEGQSYRVSTSVGVARCVDGDCTADELMRRADLALFAAKAKGRDNLAIFDHELDRSARERREIELDLRDAAARGELRLHYQPVIELDTGRTTGYEALLRWYHPARGILLPGEFLAIAEDSGMIVPIGEWVVQQALTETANWPADVRIAINLSPTQLRSPHLVGVVSQTLATLGIEARRVEFEITEHALLQESESSRATLTGLRELGAGIALDDFGTGYSSLAYLRRFPFGRIKIDRTFVEGLENSPENQAIISSITRMAEALGMSTTAEGVESRSQLDLLRNLGCDEAQGFLICKPMPVEDLFGQSGDAPEFAPSTVEILDYRKARGIAHLGRSGRVA